MKLSIVADESVDAPIVQALRDQGYLVVSVAESCPASTDEFVLALARGENAVLVTLDRDFGELVFAQGLPSPRAVIYLRSEGLTLETLTNRTLECLVHENLIGTFWTVTTKVRTRRLPAREGASNG